MSRYNTPLRYPGGKQKLTPFIIEILQTNELCGGQYVEPYAGGAGVGIELLLNGQVEHIHLNDSCFGVYAFWQSVLTDSEEICRRISSASLTIEEWRRQKEILARQKEFNRIDIGFSMFYLNRCNRSGIASGGVIGGLKQSGPWKMDARFPRNELIRRIEAIALKRKSISLKNWDAERYISEYLPKLPRKSLVYFDPPYFKKADRLYLKHYRPEDHSRISNTIQRNVKLPWIVSYDSAPEILNCYSSSRHFEYSLQYCAAKAYRGDEVFIFSPKLRIPKQSKLPHINYALSRR